MSIDEVARNVFLFSFGDPGEREMVLESEPWIFDKVLLVLKPYDADKVVDYDNFLSAKFWIHVYNLPPSGMSPEIARMIGDI